MASLEDYLDELQDIDAGFHTSANLEFNFSDQAKRAVKGTGIKTQFVLVNSLVGLISITAALIALDYFRMPSSLYIGMATYVLMILFHVLVAKGRDFLRLKT